MTHQIQGCGKKFQHVHPNYSSMDSAPQTFFYTLTNMMKLNEAKNILEVGCGAGKLLSTVLDLKSPQATYLATDVSQNMVQDAKKRLHAHFQKYQSKQTFQEWLTKQKLSFDVQDGQDVKLKQNIKFDRIIANMVLCHANHPQKMLENWNSIAEENCLLGISLLGDPVKNHLVRTKFQLMEQSGQKNIQTRPPYYWFDKISKIVESTGWEIVLEWQQNSIFPFFSAEDQRLKNMSGKGMSETARKVFDKMVQKMMNEDKVGIQAWAKVIIARKISKK